MPVLGAAATMFLLTIQSSFSAAHAITIADSPEPIHGHNWHVTAAVCGSQLDADGLLCDFHAVEAALNAVIGPYKNADLNHAHPFTTLNPTAENVALHIARSLSERLDHTLHPRAGVCWVRVTEATGCAATFYTPWGEQAMGPAAR